MAKQTWIERVKALINVPLDVYRAPIFVYGPPAVGKTWLLQTHIQNVVPITLHRGQPVEELRGMFAPSSDGKGGMCFIWQDGPVVTAMRNGHTLCINEVGEASDDVISLLYAVLDRPESSAYTLPTGEEVRPHPAFRVVATSNAAPDTLPEAIRSRFAIQIEAATVNPDAITDKPEGLQMDTRRWRAVCDLTPMFGLEGALALVVGDKEAAAIMQAIRISEAGKKV